jgi:hypothetical protein
MQSMKMRPNSNPKPTVHVFYATYDFRNQLLNMIGQHMAVRSSCTLFIGHMAVIKTSFIICDVVLNVSMILSSSYIVDSFPENMLENVEVKALCVSLMRNCEVEKL